MSNLEMKLDALLRLFTTENQEEAAAIRKDLRQMVSGVYKVRPAVVDPEYEVRHILMELGAPDHLVGHPYTVQAILLVVQDRTYIDRITSGLYPQLAVIFNTTASRVERAIRHLIEVAWVRGDWDTLNRYLGNTVSTEKGNPTNSEFIARIANVIKLRMRYATEH